MRKRYYLSFDMDDPRHREAEALLTDQGSRQRTEYVVSGLLAAKQADHIDRIIRQAVREELKDLQCPPSGLLSGKAAGETQLTDLPDSLVHALDEI